MKTLKQHINEWKLNDVSSSNVDKKKVLKPSVFTYEVFNDDDRDYLGLDHLKIFNNEWQQFKNYKDQVYLNGKKIEIDDDGWTVRDFKTGKYEFFIDNLEYLVDGSYMFSGCDHLLKVTSMNTPKLTSVEQMFGGCSLLEEVGYINTKNVKNANRMFSSCYELKNIPEFDLQKCELFEYMFCGCESLEYIPVFKLNKYIIDTMCEMFTKTHLSRDTKYNWSKIYDFYQRDIKL